MKLLGEAVFVRIHSDACTKRAGMAAVASNESNFVAELRGTANEALSKALQVINEIYGLDSSAADATVRTLGDQLRGKKLILFPETNAAAGALVEASARQFIILTMVE